MLLGDEPSGGLAEELIAHVLASRNARTRDACTYDLRDFAHFVGQESAGAVVRLLGGGPTAATRLLAEYVAELRRRGHAPATVNRRLALLARVARLTHERGLTGWELEMPDEDEIAAAVTRDPNRDVPYLVQSYPTEIDRLDLQHYALRAAIGANHLAPVEACTRVLDVGSGTGRWGFETCEEFPGFPWWSAWTSSPAGREVRRSTAACGATSSTACRSDPTKFDFVHQRLLFLGILVTAWPVVVADLMRVTRPRRLEPPASRP